MMTMQQTALQRPSAAQRLGASGRFSSAARAPARPVVCGAWKGDGEQQKPKLQGAAAAALAASILLTSAAAPLDAMAARSGGRVGGSGGFSSRSAAPRSSPAPQVRNYNSYNISPAPPVFGGYGYGFGGFGGVSLFPTFVTPIGGGIFQFFFVAMIASALISAVRGLAGSRRRDDKWDD